VNHLLRCLRRLLVVPACVLLVAVPRAFVLPSVAFADGEGPTRKMTPAEMTAYNHVRDTVRGALPGTPAGYTLQFSADGEEGQIAEAVQPGQMYRARFTARYTLDRDVIDQKQQSMLMDRTKGTPEQQAKLAELNAKDDELGKARDATRDRAEKDRIRAERKEVQARINKLMDEIAAGIQAWIASGGAAQETQDLGTSLPARELTIRVLVNGDTHLPDKAAPYKIEGVPLAFEQAEGCADFDTYCITVFLGPFAKVKKVADYTGYQLAEANLGVPTKPRGIILTFSGPKDRPDAVRDFVRQADLARIKALLP
jgi:hypothetical protein